MKNFEKFEKEIMRIVREGHNIAIQNGFPVRCENISCVKCDCYGTGEQCRDKRREWMESEYKERPKLTKKERKFLELLEGKDIWMVRNKIGTLYIYTIRPVKGCDDWSASGYACTVRYYGIFDVLEIEFKFIQWEDEEPWSVEELLKLEVEE